MVSKIITKICFGVVGGILGAFVGSMAGNLIGILVGLFFLPAKQLGFESVFMIIGKVIGFFSGICIGVTKFDFAENLDEDDKL